VDKIDNGSRNFRHYPLALKIIESSPHPPRDGGDLRTHNGKFAQLCVPFVTVSALLRICFAWRCWVSWSI